jgi:hypothetical protein
VVGAYKSVEKSAANLGKNIKEELENVKKEIGEIEEEK